MISIIIPFHNNPGLHPRQYSSLSLVREDLNSLCSKLILIDDSPHNKAHSRSLDSLATDLRQILNLPVELIKNDRNLGFVKSANIGLSLASSSGQYSLLLNSDCFLRPGVLYELYSSINLDDKFAFACPRSTNATIASYPGSLDTSFLECVTSAIPSKILHPEHNTESVISWHRETCNLLPKYTIAPTLPGSCLLIKNTVLEFTGLLDESYSPGYEEENDLILRANEYGFRAIIANHALVVHSHGSHSFGAKRSNRFKILHYNKLINRFPYYPDVLAEYKQSIIVRQLSFLHRYAHYSSFGRFYSIGFDLTNLGPFTNGTSRLAIELLSRLATTIPESHLGKPVNLYVVCNQATFDYHIDDKIPNVTRACDSNDSAAFDQLIRFGQIFAFSDLVDFIQGAMKTTVFMLDAIASDCLYISTQHKHLDSVWRGVFHFTSQVYYISDYTCQKFALRFPSETATADAKTLLLSTDLGDYYSCREGLTHNTHRISFPMNKKGYLLVFGNHFLHKALDMTLRSLLKMTDFPIVVIGSTTIHNSRVQTFTSGMLDDPTICRIYRQSHCVIYPSSYEGFGFPVLESLALGCTTFVRESSLITEIQSSCTGDTSKLISYASNEELVRLICSKQLNISHQSNPDDCPIDHLDHNKPSNNWHVISAELTTSILSLSDGFRSDFQCYSQILKKSETLVLLAKYITGSDRLILRAILQSRTWRKTYPIRFFLDAIKRLFRKL